MHDHIHDETYKVSCDLVKLHEKFPILHVITNYHDLKNVLWDSTFIESISPDEKKKYLNYDNIYIDHNELKKILQYMMNSYPISRVSFYLFISLNISSFFNPNYLKKKLRIFKRNRKLLLNVNSTRHKSIY